MFERLGGLTHRFRFVVVAAWIGIAGGAMLFAPSLAGEGMTDQSAFLPPETASMRAQGALDRAFPRDTASSSATISFARHGGLTDADRAFIETAGAWITSPDAPDVLRDAVASVDTAESRPELESMLRSDDGELELMTVNVNVSVGGENLATIVSAVRERLAEGDRPAGLQANVTGTAGISSDYLDAIVRGTDSTTLVTVVLVVVILLLIYRAPLAALVPLVTIGAAFLVARGVLGLLAAAGWKLSSLLDTFIVVLVFGVGTDYAIFLISRFREEVGHRTWRDASIVTEGRIGAVIAASAGTVIVGLGSMAFGDFGMIQTTGPALGVAVFVTLVAGLTLTPALLAIFGHYLFWPLHERTVPKDETRGFFAALAATVARRPGLVTAVLLLLLLVPAAAVPQMRTNFDVLAELPTASDARAGFDQVAAHMGRGMVVHATGIVDLGQDGDALSPAALAELHRVMQALADTPGIATVTSIVSPDGDGVLPDDLRPSNQLGAMADEIETGDRPARHDAAGGAPAILDPEVDSGLATVQAYLEGLGEAFPDMSDGQTFEAAVADVAAARRVIVDAREAGSIPGQLRDLRHALLVPAGGAESQSTGVLVDYLDELASAYPSVREVPAFDRASGAAADLARGPSASAVLDLSRAVEDLAAWFDDQPEAVLYPDSLAGTDAALQRRREIEATFERIPRRLESLSAILAKRPDDIFAPVGLDGETGDQLAQAVDAFVSLDRTATRFYVTTTDDPYSASAFASIRRAQDVLAAAAPAFGNGASADLGGPTAQVADVQEVLGRDFQRVGLITVLGIFIVLVILLRAVVAPLYLVGTVLLSCASAIGLSSWYFQNVLDQPGVSFYLPLMVFVLLVALGSDYNIFLMSRVREESAGRPIREGIRIASGRTGAVITSAGLILAGTFASMASAPLVVLFQIGVAVAVGVLIDTFLVRSILVPAITTLFGELAWWPSGSAVLGMVRRSPVAAALLDASAEPGAGRDEPGRTHPARRWAALALVVILPVTFAGLLVWAFGNPAGHVDEVSAAVVDSDTGANLTRADGATAWIDLGTELVTQLTAQPASGTFTWHATDAADAAAGLADGRYGAVLTIPADFSQHVAAIRGSAPSAAAPAVLELETNDAMDATLGTMAESLTAAIDESTSRGVVASYVDDVLLAVSDARGTLTDSAASAASLAGEAADLTDGAAGVSSSTGRLVTGLAELSAATSAARDGAAQLSAGVDELAAGTATLSDGAVAVDDATELAANGSEELAAGADALATGLRTMDAETTGLPAGTAALADGAGDVAEGIGSLVEAVGGLADGLDEMKNETTGLGGRAERLDAGAAKVASSATQLASGSADLATGAELLAGNADDLAGSVGSYTSGVAELAANCEALGGGEPLCTQLRTVSAAGPAIADGADKVAAGAGRVADSSASLRMGAAELADGAATLEAGTSQLAGTAPQLESGIAEAADGAQQLASGADTLAAGSAQLADGVQLLNAYAPGLSAGIADAAAGATRLADGTDEMATGLARLEAGTDLLVVGSSRVAEGAAALSAGSAVAASGTDLLADGMDEAADGARLFGAEVDEMGARAGGLRERITELGDGLSSRAGGMPAYGDDERDSIGRLVADPVGVVTNRLYAVPAEVATLAPYFMALGAWVGGLAIFLILPAVGGRGEGRRHRGLEAFAAATAIGIVQFTLMAAVLALMLGTSIAQPVGLVAFGVAATITFVAICQALVALLGARGWLLALGFVALQLVAAGGAWPVQTAPGPLQAIHPLLPMTHAVEGLRALLAGGGGVGLSLLALLVWLAGALVVTAIAAHRRGGQEQRAVFAATS